MIMDTEIVKCYIIPLAMGFGLSACAGLRAWIPLFIVSLLSHFDVISLNEKMAFLSSTKFIWACSAATVLELAGDKIPWLDHFLDAAGAFIRPAAGIVLGSAVITNSDPTVMAIAGIIGGGTALTVCAGKASARALVSVIPFGRTTASFLEDAASVLGSLLGILLPIIGFMLCVVLVWLSVKLITRCVKCGIDIRERFRKKSEPAETC